MPQITTWLIVSEQMSRLRGIWARLVWEPALQLPNVSLWTSVPWDFIEKAS